MTQHENRPHPRGLPQGTPGARPGPQEAAEARAAGPAGGGGAARKPAPGGGAGGKQGGGAAAGQGGPKPGGGAGRQGQAPARGPAGKPGQTGGGPGGPAPVVQIRPIAEPARLRRRHWGLLASLVLLVLLPLAAIGFYLWEISTDQYASTTGFTVRKEETGTATELLGGLADFAGAGGSSDASVLYEFIQSQEIVERINARLDLVGLYSGPWPDDPVFALWPDATIEDLLGYWQRMVRISYDKSSGLIELRVLAFSPEVAQRVAREIVSESQSMINDLNAAARSDLMHYAEADLQRAVARLKDARQALTAFRSRTQMADPSAEIQGQMGVLASLQQQLVEAQIELDLVSGETATSDPRVAQARHRIEVIRDRIAQEREKFATAEVGGVGSDYPTLIAEYEGLTVDREFAEETYRAALAAVDVARDKISRQSLYLATYVEPTLAQSAEYPRRPMLFGLAALFLLMAWAIGALVFYSLRDRQ